MSTLHQASHALQTALGFALLAELALVSGCAWADPSGEPGQPDELLTGEAADALDSSAPVGIHRCMLSGGLQPGSLVVHPGYYGQTTCAILNREFAGSSKLFCSGSHPFTTCADCADLRTFFACPVYVDHAEKQ